MENSLRVKHIVHALEKGVVVKMQDGLTLSVINPPESGFYAIVGMEFEVDMYWIYLNGQKWAERIGFTKIRLMKGYKK